MAYSCGDWQAGLSVQEMNPFLEHSTPSTQGLKLYMNVRFTLLKGISVSSGLFGSSLFLHGAVFSLPLCFYLTRRREEEIERGESQFCKILAPGFTGHDVESKVDWLYL